MHCIPPEEVNERWRRNFVRQNFKKYPDDFADGGAVFFPSKSHPQLVLGPYCTHVEAMAYVFSNNRK
jgi:hypothetical protein